MEVLMDVYYILAYNIRDSFFGFNNVDEVELQITAFSLDQAIAIAKSRIQRSFYDIKRIVTV